MNEEITFKEMLEDVLSKWKHEQGISDSFFYAEDYHRNKLMLYSINPGQLIGEKGWTIKMLGSMLAAANIRFDGVDVKKFKGGYIK